MHDMDEMMIRLQTIVAHQEEEITRLSNELYTQQQEVQKLKQQMALVIDRFRTLQDAADNGQDKIAEPPPPHY